MPAAADASGDDERCFEIRRIELEGAGQLLEFLQALALFVQQALLAVADQVAVAGGGEGGGAGKQRQ
ncbi:hypothetical protein ABI36_0230220 [Pseudomonas aeruginosa]|nr:hypothetical protein ABI36_0230220 [Pseudomonas aeruginosa]